MVSEIENDELSIRLATTPPEVLLTPNIGVVGVGGAGGNAINNMVLSQLSGVALFAANTDAQALSRSLVADKIQLGVKLTKGLGAGAKPEVGKLAAEESEDKIKEALSGLHLLFLTAGMGGGTGTGAAPVVARIAKEMNILTVGVVSKPFEFESNRRMRVAEQGIIELQKYVDTLIVIPNQNLYRIAGEKMTFAEALKAADNVLCQGVRSITDLIMRPGIINLDFEDVRTVLSSMGRSMMGTGEASGENRALEAAEQAIFNPLLDNTSIKGAKSLLLNISGAMDMTLDEVYAATERIRKEIDPEANLIFGSTLDEEFTGKMRVSLVATGIDDIVNNVPEAVVSEPVMPEPKVVEISPTIKPKIITDAIPDNLPEEPSFLSDMKNVEFSPSPVNSLSDTSLKKTPENMVIDLDETDIIPEPDLIQDEPPILSDIQVINEIPEKTASIEIENNQTEENLKSQPISIWDSLTKLLKPKADTSTEKVREKTLLDELESDIDSDMDLPKFLINPKK